MSPNIETIISRYCEGAEWIEKSLGFSRCTSLSSFTMWIYDKRLSLGDRTWRYIETILARLPSGVREPTICIGAPHRGYATWLALSLQSNQWKAVQDNIDRLLGSRRLRLAVHASSTLTGMRFIPLSKQYDRATDLASRKYALVSEVGRILVTINTSSPG